MNVQTKSMQQLATLCYVRNEGKTLMLCKDRNPASIHFGKYNGLGGKMNRGETPDECVVREVYEESGLKIQDPFFHGELTFPGFSENCDWHVYVYSAFSFLGELAESEEGSLHWVIDEEITSLNLWEGDREFLPLILKGAKFMGSFIYKDQKLVSFDLKIKEN